MCGQATRVEAKGTAPKRSSRWRTVNPDGSQHSCHLRKRPIRPNRFTVAPDDDEPEPIDLTRQLLSTQPYHRFRRYDGFDSQLHHSLTRTRGAW